MSWKQWINVAISFVIIIAVISSAATGAESVIATKVSGGENHTLVLTESKYVWACGSGQELGETAIIRF